MIRVATLSDVPAIAGLNHGVQQLHATQVPALFKKPTSDPLFIAWLADALTKPAAYVLLAEAEGKPVGYLYAEEIRKDESWIRPALHFLLLHHIAVDLTFQGRGFGDALLKEFFSEARRRNVTRVELDVWNFNEKAQRFFRKHGFSVFNQRMETFICEEPNSERSAAP